MSHDTQPSRTFVRLYAAVVAAGTALLVMKFTALDRMGAWSTILAYFAFLAIVGATCGPVFKLYARLMSRRSEHGQPRGFEPIIKAPDLRRPDGPDNE
jgi:hypothetical protein